MNNNFHAIRLPILPIILFVLLALVTVAIGAIDLSGQSRKTLLANDSWTHQSRGVQDADRVVIVAQKAKIKKAHAQKKNAAKAMDPQKAVDSLNRIDREKMEHYKAINGTLEEQKNLMDAYANKSNTQEMQDNFKVSSDNAYSALKELRRLTDEQIDIYNQTTKDEQAIKTANSTYYTWENAVSGLSSEPLDDAKLAELDKKIHDSANEAVASANEEAKSVTPEDVAEEDKTIIKDELLTDGSSVQSGMRSTMEDMSVVFSEIIKVMQVATGKSSNPLGKVIGAIKGSKSVPLDANVVEVLKMLQSFFNMMASNMASFDNSFGGLMQSTGAMAGVQVEQAPALTVPSFDIGNL